MRFSDTANSEAHFKNTQNLKHVHLLCHLDVRVPRLSGPGGQRSKFTSQAPTVFSQPLLEGSPGSINCWSYQDSGATLSLLTSSLYYGTNTLKVYFPVIHESEPKCLLLSRNFRRNHGLVQHNRELLSFILLKNMFISLA